MFFLRFQSLDRLMSVTVLTTLKRRLNDEEIQQISTKRFKALETEYTRNDDEESQDEDDDGADHSDGNANDQGDGNSQNDNDGEGQNKSQSGINGESGGNGQDDGDSDGNNQVNIKENNENVQTDENVSSPKVNEQPVIPGEETDEVKLGHFQQSHPLYEIAA